MRRGDAGWSRQAGDLRGVDVIQTSSSSNQLGAAEGCYKTRRESDSEQRHQSPTAASERPASRPGSQVDGRIIHRIGGGAMTGSP